MGYKYSYLFHVQFCVYDYVCNIYIAYYIMYLE